MADYPEELRYTKDHEWARINGNLVQIGITAFAVEKLGDITEVELPDEGDTVAKGEVFGSVDSVKTVSDLYSPVTGTVTKVNSPLNDSPEYVQEEPYGEGWMVEVEAKDLAQLEELMSAAAYREFIADQE